VDRRLLSDAFDFEFASGYRRASMAPIRRIKTNAGSTVEERRFSAA
jgi:hypothetical protein